MELLNLPVVSPQYFPLSVPASPISPTCSDFSTSTMYFQEHGALEMLPRNQQSTTDTNRLPSCLNWASWLVEKPSWIPISYALCFTLFNSLQTVFKSGMPGKNNSSMPCRVARVLHYLMRIKLGSLVLRKCRHPTLCTQDFLRWHELCNVYGRVKQTCLTDRYKLSV